MRKALYYFDKWLRTDKPIVVSRVTEEHIETKRVMNWPLIVGWMFVVLVTLKFTGIVEFEE
ncbi:hypothetical protein AB9K34_00865 [Sedimentitalea sp. XS_ASV28]|uniref:hypothetical protein n=1 Tax=Sedimentitalea sp. XS_ASV28 TaxID=3241296 RepID=UPI0035115703